MQRERQGRRRGAEEPPEPRRRRRREPSAESSSSEDFAAGDRVEAQFEGEWLPATVKRVGRKRIRVVFDGYDDVEKLRFEQVRSPQRAEPRESPRRARASNHQSERNSPYKQMDKPSRQPYRPQRERRPSKWVGKKINTLFDGEYFPAEVLADLGGGSYSVRFDGYIDEETVQESDFQRDPSPPPKKRWEGEHVDALFEGEYFPAVVVKDNGNDTFDVRFDGYMDIETVSVDDIKQMGGEAGRAAGRPSPPRRASPPRPHALIGQDVQGRFDDGWFDARVLSQNVDGSFLVEWDEFDGTDTLLERDIRERAPQFSVGDRVQAPFEDELLPAQVTSAQAGRNKDEIEVEFEGYEGEFYSFPPSKLQALSQPGKKQSQQQDEPTFTPDEDVVTIAPDGQKAWVKDYLGRGKYKVKYFESRSFGTHHESEMTIVANYEQIAVCVFACLRKRAVHIREFNDVAKTLFGRYVREFDQVVTNRNGDPAFPQGQINEYEDEILELKPGEPIPAVPGYCPALPDIICGERVLVVVDGEEQILRVRNFQRETNTYECIDRDKNFFTFHRGDMTKTLSMRDKARLVFGACGKKDLSRFQFQGMWNLLFPNKDEPDKFSAPRLERVAGTDQIEWDEVELVSNNGIPVLISWKGGDLPDAPEIMPEFVPKFFPGEDVQFENEGEILFGRCGDFNGETYCVNARVKRNEEWSAEEFQVDPDDLQQRIKAPQKIRDVFGLYQRKKLTFEEVRLALRVYWDERVFNLERLLENVSAVDVNGDTKRVTWVEDELPVRQPQHRCLFEWRNNAKCDVLADGRWLPAYTVKCERKEQGLYRVRLKGGEEEQRTVSVRDMRISMTIVQKVRAVFSKVRSFEIDYDVLNAKLHELFQDRGLSFPLHERVADYLGRENITDEGYCVMLHDEELPPENLMDIWNIRESMDTRSKVKAVFMAENSKKVTPEQFARKYRELFDDTFRDLRGHFDKEWNWEFTYADDGIEFEGDLEPDEDDEHAWLKGLIGKDVDWANQEREQREEYNVEDANVLKRSTEEVEAYRSSNCMVYEGEKPWPRPATTFEEAFERYNDHKVLAPCVDVFMKEFRKQGWTAPTRIQQACWPLIYTGRDVLGISKTGSGKTLGFGLPMLLIAKVQKASSRNDRDSRGYGPNKIYGLILNHTRELCIQTWEVLKPYGDKIGVNVVKIMGKMDRRELEEGMRKGIDIAVATQGRLLDQIKRKKISLINCMTICLDEADQMLKGTDHMVREILLKKMRPGKERQCLLFSATYSDEVEEMHHGFYVNRPIRISIGEKRVRADPNVQQHFAYCTRHEQRKVLISTIRHILAQSGQRRIFVFFNSKRTCDDTFYHLTGNVPEFRGLVVKCHGDMDQQDREQAVRDFKAWNATVLLATDVISRGVNIFDVTVIQYGFPEQNQADSMPKETYIHRLGRAGRAGGNGECYTIFFQEPVFDCWEVLEDVGQYGPDILCKARAPPDDVELPEDMPAWALGNSVFGASDMQPKQGPPSRKARGGGVPQFGERRVMVFWEADGQTYPGFCLRVEGATAVVILDDFPDDEYDVPLEHLSLDDDPLKDKALEPVKQSEHVGRRVQVDYEGELFPATILDDFQNGSVLIEYDGDFPDEEIEINRVVFEEAPAFAVGARVEVMFDGEPFVASILEPRDDGYLVRFDADFPEEVVPATDITPLPATSSKAKFPVGTLVSVDYDGEQYLATVVQCLDEVPPRYVVSFQEDFPDETLAENKLSLVKDDLSRLSDDFTPKTRVQVLYSDGQRYPATVLCRLESGKYSVLFDEFDDPEEVEESDLSILDEHAVEEQPVDAPPISSEV